jgi:predicted outer membrane protein
MIMDGYTDQQILQIHSEISQADIDAAKQQLLNSNNEAASTSQTPAS